MSSAYVHAGGAAHAAAVAIANAIKASGAIVKLAPEEFAKILAKLEEPVIIHSIGGFFSKKHQYLTNYKGFIFFTQSKESLPLPYKSEMIASNSIWVPQ